MTTALARLDVATHAGVDLAPSRDDVAGDLALELAEQRKGQDVAAVTGFPGLSTLHCLTVRIDALGSPRS